VTKGTNDEDTRKNNGNARVGGPRHFRSNTPPALICPAPVNLDCTPTNGANLTLTAMVSDAQMDALTVLWLVDGNRYQTNTLAQGNTLNPCARDVHSAIPADQHDVQVIVTDGQSEVSCKTTVDIRADLAPEIHSLTATPNVALAAESQDATRSC
jgi:hypothetical protein